MGPTPFVERCFKSQTTLANDVMLIIPASPVIAAAISPKDVEAVNASTVAAAAPARAAPSTADPGGSGCSGNASTSRARAGVSSAYSRAAAAAGGGRAAGT